MTSQSSGNTDFINASNSFSALDFLVLHFGQVLPLIAFSTNCQYFPCSLQVNLAGFVVPLIVDSSTEICDFMDFFNLRRTSLVGVIMLIPLSSSAHFEHE